MDNCIYCGGKTYTSVFVPDRGAYAPVCEECRKKLDHKRLEEKLSRVDKASDFKDWGKRDMSEAFWMHLIEYQKRPNKHSLCVLETALLWAVHDDHGLSNSFTNALDWCKIDLYEESQRLDLPDK